MTDLHMQVCTPGVYLAKPFEQTIPAANTHVNRNQDGYEEGIQSFLGKREPLFKGE